jgi:hypothetical protein
MTEVAAPLRSGLVVARKAYRKLRPDADVISYAAVTVTGQAASDLIKERLAANALVMIGRLGSTELTCVRNYLGIHGDASALRRALAFVNSSGGPLWWDEGNVTDMMRVSGFFPRDAALLERFCVQLLEDMKMVDVLGSWLTWERNVASHLEQAVRVRLRDLEPYYHADPWSEVLRDKTVLVIHPFAESIASQYARSAQLFADSRILPDFELKTLKAVQSHADNDTPFRTWFDAYDSMREAMSEMEFDIALIGAGAYGFSLAADVKRCGKKAVHLGGATQILFGIKGTRWDDHPVISGLYNEHWVRPLPSERPAKYLSVEGGSYW